MVMLCGLTVPVRCKPERLEIIDLAGEKNRRVYAVAVSLQPLVSTPVRHQVPHSQTLLQLHLVK
jgi:hypothetical protein